MPADVNASYGLLQGFMAEHTMPRHRRASKPSQDSQFSAFAALDHLPDRECLLDGRDCPRFTTIATRAVALEKIFVATKHCSAKGSISIAEAFRSTKKGRWARS